MHLALQDMHASVAAAAKPPSRALVSRLYATTGSDHDRLLWSEFDSEPAVDGRHDVRLTLMRQTQSVGADGPLQTPWLYLVHTDIAPDLLAEYDAWYGEEHLPRLVKVPGILRARRFVATLGSPQFLTAYDLMDSHAFESPEGLVARKTPWTERMRSQFTNTRRIMCKLIDI